MVAHIITLVVHFSAYLDDLLVACPTFEHSLWWQTLLMQAGFLLHLKKSELGMTLDLVYIDGRL